MSNVIIRKISIGLGFPDNSLHFQVGKEIRLQQNPYKISSISIDKKIKEQESRTVYNVYIQNEEGTLLWKSISGMPIVLETDITFD